MKTMVALGLSSDAIRLAVVGNPYTPRPLIKQWHTFTLPAGAVVDGEVVDQPTVTGMMKEIIKRHHVPTGNVALVYSSRRILFREASFPEMGLDELRATLPFQAKNLIPLPIPESVLDFVPLKREKTNQGYQLHGLLVASLRSGIEKTANAVEQAGLIVTSVDASAFSIARLYKEESLNGNIVLVNVGSNSTDVIVVNNGMPIYLRTVPSGADDVTQAVAMALSIDFEDAEEVKRRIGLQNVVGDKRLEKAEEVIRESTAQLIVSIRNSLNMFASTHPEEQTGDILLTGAGATLEGFPNVLATSTNMVVTMGDPFSKFDQSKESIEQEKLTHASGYSIVLGLALGKKPR